MTKEFKSRCRSVEERIEAKAPDAFDEAVKLTEQFPAEAEAWNTLAYANKWKKDYPAAVAAITRAIELRPGRPGLYFTRGGSSLMAGDYDGAIADFTEGLALGNHKEQEAYREVLYFHRAEAYYQLGRTTEAIADLEHVDDDCTSWTVQVRSKADLLALCGVVVPPADQDAEAAPKIPVSLEPDAHLLMEDRSILPEAVGEDEAAVLRELGVEGLAKADATILKWVPRRWAKVARVLFDAIQADDLDPTNTHARVYLRRLIALADSGAIEAVGNLHRPRFSEVRLPEPD